MCNLNGKYSSQQRELDEKADYDVKQLKSLVELHLIFKMYDITGHSMLDKTFEENFFIYLEVTNQTERLEAYRAKEEERRLLALKEEQKIALEIFKAMYEPTLERIARPNNIIAAIKKVKANGGAPGVDRVTTKQFADEYLENTKKILEIQKDILDGTYKPQAVRRQEIPKDDGSKRLLGIPRVYDRVVQQAFTNVLQKWYEPLFSNFSYGYRPNKSAHSALRQAYSYLQEGYSYVIDMDLEKFFDTVNHDKLKQVLSIEVADGRIISVINKMLKAKVMNLNGTVEKPKCGTPQGGVISPILANILLNELDQLLQKRGHRFVRYADDMIIFCKSKRVAERAFKSIKRYIEKKLFLKVNENKTKIGRMNREFKFLGHCFYLSKRKWHMTIHKKKRIEAIGKVKELLTRKPVLGIAKTVRKFNSYIRGWFNYYKYTTIFSLKFFRKLDELIRRRYRHLLWKHWKTRDKRLKELVRRGGKKETVLQIGLSNNRLMKRKGFLNPFLTNDSLAGVDKLEWTHRYIETDKELYQKINAFKQAKCKMSGI